MYGKHFSSMYERSMVGSGAMVFAVMGYVISNSKLDKAVGGQVTLNPDVLGPILGEKPADVQKAIDFLCKPDPRSSTKAEQGRRLIRVGEFDYRVVNFAKYRAMRNEEERREQNRIAQGKHRAKMTKRGTPLSGEATFVATLKDEGIEAADATMPPLPPACSGPIPIEPPTAEQPTPADDSHVDSAPEFLQ